MIASALARHIVYENLYKEKIHVIFVDHAERNRKFLQELFFFMIFKGLYNKFDG